MNTKKGITKISEYVIHCDFCTAYHIYHGFRKKDAINSAREDGWNIGENIKCPDCQGKE